MKKLLSIILLITMLFAMSLAAPANNIVVCPEDTELPQEVKILKVGTNAGFKPFEYYDENGNLTGFDIDLMNYIGERIGFEIEYVDMSFDKLIPAVTSGEVACAISAISQTDERREVVDFSRPYLRATITYNDGETSTKSQEVYSIVFKEGMSNTLLKSSFPTEDEKKYLLITGALDELISDGTVDKLIEKYSLNKALEEDIEYHYKYDTVKGSQTPAAKSDTEITMSEEMTMITVPAPSEWAAKDIDFAYAMGITDSNKEYIYQNNITREEFCELIYKLTRIVGVDIEDASEDFTDTDNKSVAALFTMGIINGKTSTEFAPDDSLTREEAATIIIRMISKVMPMAATEEWFEYDDIDEISDWASDSIQTISNLGFMNGVGENKFAPKDTYTVEQAIATLVRVYKSAEATGVIEQISDIGIIGGADGPTSIIVGDNINVIEQEDYEDFYVEVQTKTTKIDDFYVDEALKLITESAELAADKEFISYYTLSTEVANKISELAEFDYSNPTEIYYMAADREQIISRIYNITDLSNEELDGFDIEKLLELNIVNFSVIGNMINASYGSENLAAITILINNRGYIMPKDFKNDFALYLQYDGDYSAIVSFYEYGDGVISANMSFVKNGDKDNVFRRMYEITTALGEDSIKFAKVKP